MEGAYGQNRYQVGDIIQMNHDDFGLIKWRVIGVDVDQAAGHRHTLTVAMERAETYRWFPSSARNTPSAATTTPAAPYASTSTMNFPGHPGGRCGNAADYLPPLHGSRRGEQYLRPYVAAVRI